jgi:hypothetical protein
MSPRRVRLRSQAGQTAAEYLGALVVVAVVIAALANSVVGVQVRDAMERAICMIAAGVCDDAPTVPGTTTPTAPDQNAPPPLDQAKVDAAVDDIRDALDGGVLGVRGGDLERIQEILAGLSPQELDAAIASLSDDDLERLFDQMHDSGLFGGWDEAHRRSFLNMLAENASAETLRRIARFTDELQPSFADVGGDDARDDPDSPVADASWGTFPQQPFIPGEDDGGAPVHPNDVAQGALGDCWFMASVMAIAQQHPELIEQMIRRNANGSYTVTFRDDDGDPIEITVSDDLPVNPDGDPIFAHEPTEGDMSGDAREVWPMILEKAFALYKGNYDDIESDWPETALDPLTGIDTEVHDTEDVSLSELADVHESGGAALVSSHDEEDTPLYEDGTLVTNHVYNVSDVDEEAGTVTLQNPWGYDFDPITISYDEFRENFGRVDINALVD